MNTSLQLLPSSWIITKIEDVCQILDFKRIPINNSDRSKRIASIAQKNLYPYYGATGQVGYINDFLFNGEYVLVGEDGAPFLDPIKDKAYIVTGKFWVNNHAHILNAYASNKFICHFLNQFNYAESVSGTTRLKLNQVALKAIPVIFPPLSEQHRIVAKIEELFSKLDNGIAALKTAREQLKVYRQAVLKHAFEGKLTAKWREENKDKLETPKQLLVRIQQEREKRYEQQVIDWEQAVKDWEAGGKNEKKPGKLKQASIIPLSNDELVKLPEIPKGYAYTYLSNLGELGRGKSKHRPRNAPQLFGGKYPFLQTGEVKAAKRIITNHSQTYSEFGLNQSKLWPKGTLCITIAANIAETAFLGFDACFPDSIVGFNAEENIISPLFIELFIKAVRVRIEAYAPATAQKNINLTTLENLIVPYCSLNEQKQVIKRIELEFSIIDQNEFEIDQALARAEILRQSILKKTFSGQLVPQDPNDEPASKLLARIQAEKANIVSPRRKNKTKKKHGDV